MVPTFSGTRILLTGSVLIAGITSPLGGQAPDYDAEIRGIGERSDVRAAFQAIDSLQDQGRADLITLTEIPAPPFMETERARAYAEMLRQAGADSVWTDDIGNVLSLRRGRSGDRTVAIDAHLDTVFPEGTDVSVRVRGDTLLAPGVGDDTQGLVLVLTVLRALEAADIQTEGDILIIATVGEEGLGDLRGVKHLFRPGGPEIDSWIAVDGGDASRVAHQAVGSYRYRITVRGPGGHSWGAFGLANPHHALARMIHHFVEAADPYTREGTKTSYNIGRIGGGTSINSIPFESWMEVDMRSLSPERLDHIEGLLIEAVDRGLAGQNDLRRQGDEMDVEVASVGRRPSGSVAEETALVQRAVAATRYVGVEPVLGSGSTNSNIPISLGVPAVTIGKGGRSQGAHSLDEWIVLEGTAAAARKALLIVLAEADVSTPRSDQ
jgi:acetylornithine deacetylase/succinyl-diaminopimelate desuccinylase-like protein